MVPKITSETTFNEMIDFCIDASKKGRPFKGKLINDPGSESLLVSQIIRKKINSGNHSIKSDGATLFEFTPQSVLFFCQENSLISTKRQNDFVLGQRMLIELEVGLHSVLHLFPSKVREILTNSSSGERMHLFCKYPVLKNRIDEILKDYTKRVTSLENKIKSEENPINKKKLEKQLKRNEDEINKKIHSLSAELRNVFTSNFRKPRFEEDLRKLMTDKDFSSGDKRRLFKGSIENYYNTLNMLRRKRK